MIVTQQKVLGSNLMCPRGAAVVLLIWEVATWQLLSSELKASLRSTWISQIPIKVACRPTLGRLRALRVSVRSW